MNKIWISVGLGAILVCPCHGGNSDERSVVKLVQEGRAALAAGDKTTARALADAAVARDSGYAEAWKLMAMLRLQAGETNAAAQAFRTALLIAPRDSGSNRELAWLMWEKDLSQALVSLDVVIQAGSPDRDALIRRVVSLLAETGQDARALECFAKWKPSFTRSELGITLYSDGRHVASALFLNAAWQAGESRPTVALYLAALEGRKGRPERVSSYLKAFFEKAPDTLTPEQVELLWDGLMGAKNDDSLKPLWSRIVSAYPVEPGPRADLAKRFEGAAVKMLRRGDDQTAHEFYRQALALDPKRVSLQDWIMVEERVYGTGNLMIAKSRACAASSDWEGALRMALMAVTNDVADAEAWKQAGVVYSRMQNYAESRTALEKSVSLKTNDVVVFQELGWTLWSLSDRKGACEAWDKAIGLGVKEQDRFVIQVLGRMAEDGQKELALERQVRWLPGTPVLSTGLEFFKMGRMKAAEPFLAKAWADGGESALSGLALARVRAVNGSYAGTPDYLMPYITSCLATAAPPDVFSVLDTLRLCSGVTGAGAALEAAAKALQSRTDQAAVVTDVYIAFARDDLDRAKLPSAMAFYEKALDRDPNRLIWPIAWNLANRMKDVPRGLALLQAIQDHATVPAVRDGVAGKLAELRGDWVAARTGYSASLKGVPDQPEIHSDLFDVSLKLGDLDQARREADWMEARVNEGQTRFRDTLAMMWTEMGEDAKALELWQFLHLAMPDVSFYGTEMAMAQYRTGRGSEAVDTLKGLIRQNPSPLAYELLAQILSALGRPAEAVEWSRQGLAVYSSPALRRSLAENWEAVEGSGVATSTLAAATASLADDRGSASLSLLVGRSLVDSGRVKDAVDMHEALLQRNPDFAPGLVFLRDQEIVMERPRRALPYAERLKEARPWDDMALRRYAMNLAEADGFSRAIRILEPLAGQNEKKVMATLLYSTPTPFDYAGMNTVSQMVSHVVALAKAGFVFVNTLSSGATPEKAVMMILMNPDRAVVETLDAALQVNGACAVMMVSPESLCQSLPRKLPPARLAELKRSGRWQIGVTLPDLGTVKVRADGIKGNPLTHRIISGEVLESSSAMTNRIGETLSLAANALAAGEPRWFYYPGGDYGQVSLDTDQTALEVLSNQVGRVFDAAFCRDDNGFSSAMVDRVRLPAKAVPASWDSVAVVDHLKKGNPVVRARLELAKLFYWHGQSEAATYWFGKAGDAGADPFEITFNKAANAAMAGDLPVALKHAREAVTMAPSDDARPARLLEKALDMRRPTASLHGTAWRDNEDRSYWDIRGEAEGPVRDWLRWSAGGSRHHWEKKGLGSEEGSRADLGFLAYIAPEVWVQAGLQEWFMDSLPDIDGWQARLHVPNHWLRGNIEVTSEREMMETVEALRKGITAHREGIETYSRIYDFWDCFLSGAITERSDGNSTWWVNTRIIRRLKETPYLGVGYAGRFADSTDVAPEYWSPEELQQHQAYAAWQGTGVKWNGQLSGQAGYAKERNTDWRFVWGARAVAIYKFTTRLSAGGDVTYQGGPIYNRTTVDAFLNLRW
ncbi:MAG: tetratricopeptide repeat protein [bacterium]